MAIAVLIVLFSFYIIARNDPDPEPNTVVFMRILLTLACGVLGGTIPGFLNVEYSFGGLVIRAFGAAALAVLVYVFTPQVLPSLRTRTEIILDQSRIGDIGALFKKVNSYWDLPKRTDEYQKTPLDERKKLITAWIGDDASKNNAVLEVTKFVADVHGCIDSKRCVLSELCTSSLFDDADNFLLFFDSLLDNWAAAGHEQTLKAAQAFISCDCYRQRNEKRCKNHKPMCNAPPNCEGLKT
ncbi:hypothetical protein BSN85_16300 [Bradyrhizobium brasilense]|nr:hypothetical protein BSN85_16300 [Bradyrhizobium brasilense]